MQVGSVINDYKIIELIGETQAGKVYFAQRKLYETENIYTMRVLDIEALQSLGINVEILKKELEILKSVTSSPTCNKYTTCYYDYFMHNTVDEELKEHLIVITDYIQGETLDKLIIEQRKKGIFQKEVLIKMMIEITQAVEFIHNNGIVHQNIKPSNLVYDSELKRIKLIDFTWSCSKELGSECDGNVGTFYYQPPELISSTGPVNYKMRIAHDIWSMGVVFYQLANLGEPFIAFTTDDPELMKKQIQTDPINRSTYTDPKINEIISKILTKDSQRPTAAQILELLQEARPVCVINKQRFDRNLLGGVLMSLDVYPDPNADDTELCKLLSDHLTVCKIKNTSYQKRELKRITKMLGLPLDQGDNSIAICNTIQEALKVREKNYKEYVTEKLLEAIKYMSLYPTDNLKDALEELKKRYTDMYNDAKALELINSSILERESEEAQTRSLIYKQNLDIENSTLFSELAKNINSVIQDNLK